MKGIARAVASSDRALHSAAEAGDVAGMGRALAQGADVHANNYNGQAAAMLAAEEGHRDCLECAVNHGADIHARDIDGRTAAMLAAYEGYCDCLEYAVEAGASIHAKDNDGRTAAMLAAYEGYCDCLEYAVEAGANIHARDNDGRTAAMLAAYEGYCDCLEYAVEAGADIHAKDNEGRTVAMLAAEAGYRDCLEYAVEAGADINAEDNNGRTAAILAAAEGHRGCLEYAVEQGGDINADDHYGNTAAMLAADAGHRDCLEYAQGADISAEDNDGATPLMLAARNGHRRCLEYAVNQGADIKAEDNDGWTVVTMEAAGSRRNCLERAVGHGADITADDYYERAAPMLSAAQEGHQASFGCADERAVSVGYGIHAKGNDGRAAAVKGDGTIMKGAVGAEADLRGKERRGRAAASAWWVWHSESDDEPRSDHELRPRHATHVPASGDSTNIHGLVSPGSRGQVTPQRAVGSSPIRNTQSNPHIEFELLVRAVDEVFDSLDEAEMVHLKTSTAFNMWSASREELSAAESRLEAAQLEAARALKALRTGRQALKHHKGELPAAAIAMDSRQALVAKGLKVLHEAGVLQHREFEVEYEVLESIVQAGNVTLRARFRGDGSIKALRQIPRRNMTPLRQAEVVLAHTLRHDNLMNVEVVFAGSMFVYVQSSWCQNRSVAEWLTAAPRSVREVGLVAAGVLQGLAFLHNHNIVHGHLKPSNILIDDKMQPRIADWSSSRHIFDATESLPAVNHAMGPTVAYAAPEFTSHARTSYAGDMWSMGKLALALEMAAAAPASEAEERIAEVLRGIAAACCVEDMTARPIAAQVIANNSCLFPNLRQPNLAGLALRDEGCGGERRVTERSCDGTVATEEQSLHPLPPTGVAHGDLMGEYEVFDTVARGESTVLRAWLRSDGSVKALKKLKLEEVQQVQREVLIQSRLQHPNVMPVELAFISNDCAYVQSSWCKHGDVAQWLRAGKRSVREVAAVAAGVMQGLRYLHDHGVMHGDMNPTNILLDDDLRPRISDWGSSRESDIVYAAPELLVEPRAKHSFASDMWAMGKVMQALWQHAAGAVDDVEAGLMAELQGITKACCVEEAGLRPSAADVVRRSKHLLPSESLASGASASHSEVAEALGRRVVWQRREGGVCKELRMEDMPQVERGFVKYLSVRGAMNVGWHESKGDDGDGLQADDDSWHVRLGDGSTVSFRGMHAVPRDGVSTWPVRRELQELYSFPAEWPRQTANSMLVTLAADNKEYQDASRALLRDVRGAKVIKIQRVQNRYLWQRYEHQKHLLRGEMGEAGLNEVKAWQSTTNTAPIDLCSGPNGNGEGFFGRGAYFADAAYCDDGYAHILSSGRGLQVKHLIYAKVLCGTALDKGRHAAEDTIKPPPGCHSVLVRPYMSIKSGHTTAMRVVYDATCAYPGYVVTYEV